MIIGFMRAGFAEAAGPKRGKQSRKMEKEEVNHESLYYAASVFRKI